MYVVKTIAEQVRSLIESGELKIPEKTFDLYKPDHVGESRQEDHTLQIKVGREEFVDIDFTTDIEFKKRGARSDGHSRPDDPDEFEIEIVSVCVWYWRDGGKQYDMIQSKQDESVYRSLIDKHLTFDY